MAMNDPGMGATTDEDQMPPSGQGESPQQKEDEPVSVFLSKASLPADKKYKEGDKITLTVESVDSETGDIECCIYADGQEHDQQQYGDEGPSMTGFDAAMGPEKE